MKYIRTKDGIFERKFPNKEFQISFDYKTIEPAYYTVNCTVRNVGCKKLLKVF